MPVTIQHSKTLTIADFTGTVTVGNSSGGTATVAASNIVLPSDWNSTHAISLSLSASELSNVMKLGWFESPLPIANAGTQSTVTAPGVGTWYIDPFVLPGILTSGQINVMGLNAQPFLNGAVYSATLTASRTHYATQYNKLAIYKQGSGASTSRLESVWTGDASSVYTWELRASSNATNQATISNYLSASIPFQWDGSGGVTYSNVTASGTITFGASTGASTLGSAQISAAVAYVSGSFRHHVPFATTLGPGAYWMAHMISSSTSVTGTNYTAGTVLAAQSRVVFNEALQQAYKRAGASVSNTTTNIQPFHGYLATTTISASSIINTGDIRATSQRLYWNFLQSSY